MPTIEGLYTIADAREAAAELAHGLWTIRQRGENYELIHVSTRKIVPLPDARLRERPAALAIEATGFKLLLRFVGTSRLPDTDLRAALKDIPKREAQLAQLPLGQGDSVVVQDFTASETGLQLKVRVGDKTLSTVDLPFSEYVAFSFKGGVLEALQASGGGIRLRLRNCTRCGAKIDGRPQTHLWEGLEHCAHCAELLERERRSKAQASVGVCRGCRFYDVSPKRECLHPARVRAHGQLTADPVRSCHWRRPRPSKPNGR